MNIKIFIINIIEYKLSSENFFSWVLKDLYILKNLIQYITINWNIRVNYIELY